MWFLRLLTHILFSVFIRVKVIGKENLPEKGAVLLVSNHETMLDMFMIGYKIKRKVHWMAKEELFRNKLFAKIITGLGAYPVKRNSRDQAAIKATLNLLEQEKVVGIFPQGTRSRGRGLSLKAKPGTAHFAVDTGAIIQPVAIWGNVRLFGKVYVRFGKPYYIDKKSGTEQYTKDEYTEISNNIMKGIFDMMNVPQKKEKE